MSIFIATQLMEPARLRNTAFEVDNAAMCRANPLKAERLTPYYVDGTLPLPALCTLRVMGFYSSPIVLELLYSGMLEGTVPLGRDSAMRFIIQSTLSSVRRNGLFAVNTISRTDEGLQEIFKFASKLAVEEKEEGQIEIIQSVEEFFKACSPRIGVASRILAEDGLPEGTFSGAFELTDQEMIEASTTGRLPQDIIDLEAEIALPS